MLRSSCSVCLLALLATSMVSVKLYVYVSKRHPGAGTNKGQRKKNEGDTQEIRGVLPHIVVPYPCIF